MKMATRETLAPEIALEPKELKLKMTDAYGLL